MLKFLPKIKLGILINVILINKKHVKYYLQYFRKGVWGSAVNFPSGVWRRAPEAKAFLGFT